MRLQNLVVLLAAVDFVAAVSKKTTTTVAKSPPKTKTTLKTTTTPPPKQTTTTTTSKKSTTTTTTAKTTTTSAKTTTTSAKTTTSAVKTTTTSAKTTTSAVKTTATTSTSISTSTSTPTPTKNSGKRGLSFNNPVLTEPFSLSGQNSKVSWSWNWASDPYYPSGSWTPNSYNLVLTYIPCLWSAADVLTSIWNSNVANAISSYGTDSVLSFNEPDGCSDGQSCMTVSAAVSAYQQWVQPLAGTVALGSPQVSNAVGAGVGIDWLEQFMSNCTQCTVDFIPIHWYGSVLDPGSFQSYVQSFHTQFNKPIWITEFAPTSGTEAQIVSFLQQVLPWLDSQTYVSRYAYFMDRDAGSPYLLETNDTMTEIGVVYNSS